jgi:hypothetical protein
VDGVARCDGGKDSGVAQKIRDRIGEPQGKALFFQYRDDEIVVNAVKGFSVVREEKVQFRVLLHVLVVCFVQVVKMISHPTTGKKNFLVFADEALGGVDDGEKKSSSYYSIGRIVDRDGTSIANQL